MLVAGLIVFVLGVIGLFALDRDREARTSKALWIPLVWLLIIASRTVSVWLHISPRAYTAEQALEGSPLDGGIFAALVVAGLIVLAGRKQQVAAILRKNGPILVFFLYCAASILWSDYPDVAIKRWAKFVGDFVMILVVLTDTDPLAAIKRLLAWSAFLLVPLSVLMILAKQGQLYSWTGVPIWTGVGTSKSQLGMICMIFGLSSLWRLLEHFRGTGATRRAAPLISHGTIFAMVLWLFAKAHSMTPLSSFAIAGIVMVATRTALLARRPSLVHLLVAAALSVSVAAVFLDAGGLVLTLGRDPTLTGRTILWHQLLSMTVNPVLGVGYESFWAGDRLAKMWSTYWWHPNQAHNGYLEVFLNLGWIGSALLAFVLVAGYRNSVGAARRDRQTGDLKLAYFVAAVAYNLTEAAFKMTNPVWMIFLWSATAVAVPVWRGARILSRVRVRPGRLHGDLSGTPPRAYEGVV